MANVVGPRGNFGVIIPSTNTVVEAEYSWLRPEGLSIHYGRIAINQPSLNSDETFELFLDDLRSNIGESVKQLMMCEPDYLVMGMSAETFWGGIDGNARFESWIRDLSGLRVSTGASALKIALSQLNVHRIGVITPYQPIADKQVANFLIECGFDVVAITGLKCESATSISRVEPNEIEKAFKSVNLPETEALVQVGTNLATVTTASKLEKQLSKPVIAINAATWWHAMRTNGIDDKIDGFGLLLGEY